MTAFLRNTVQRLIRARMPVDAVFKTLSAIIVIRTVVEKLLSQGHTMLFDPANFYGNAVGDLQMYFSWVCIFLSMSIPVALFLRIPFRDAMKLTLAGFCITLFVPLTDYLLTRGTGDEIRYFRDFETFGYNYVNLFNPFASLKGVTAGVRIEVLTLFFGSFLVSWQGFGKGLFRSLLLAISLYTTVYFYGYILPFHQLIGIDLPTIGCQSTTHIEGAQLLFFAYLGPFFLACAGVLAIIAMEEKASARAIAAVLYPSRLLFYLLLLGFGMLFTAHEIGAYPRILNKPDLLRFASAAMSISLLFTWAKLVNDVNDLDIDRVSNRKRPLVEGMIGVEDAGRIAFVTMALSLVMAIPVGRDFPYFWLAIWALSYLYSTPPFRLRRYWPLGHLVLALVGTGVFFAGACIARPDDFYQVWKHREIALYILAAFFFLSQVKDLKDVDGDRAGGVFNLFGRVSSPKTVGMVFFGGFLATVVSIAALLGIMNGAVAVGTAACAAAATALALRSNNLAQLDRLLVVALLFLLYVSGVWLVHLGPIAGTADQPGWRPWTEVGSAHLLTS